MHDVKSSIISFAGVSLTILVGAIFWPLIWLDIYPLLNSSVKISDFQRTLYSKIYSDLDTPAKERGVWISWVVELFICALVYMYINEYVGIYVAFSSITSMVLGNSVKNFMEAK
jgi:hypothetical protein